MSAPATGTSAGAALVPARAMPLPGVNGRAPRSDLATIGAPRPGNGDGLAQRAAPPVVPRPLPSTRRIRPSSHRGEDDSESGGSLSPAASRKVPRQSWASTTGAPVPEASEARRLSEPEPPAQPPSFISTDLSSVMNAVLFRPSSRPDNTPLPKVTTLPRPDDKFYRLPSDGGDNKLASVPRLSAQEWKDSTSQLWKALPAATPAPLPTIGAVLSRLDSCAVTTLPAGLPGPYAPLLADPSTSAGPYPGVGPIPPFSNGGPPPGAPSAGPVRRKPRNSAGNKPYEYAPRAPGKYSTREALPSRPEDKPYNYNPQPVRAMAPGRTPGYTPQLLVPYVVPSPVFPQPAWALNYKAKNRPMPPPDVALDIYNPFSKPPESLPGPVAPDEPVASSSSLQPPRAPPLASDLPPTPAPPRRASNGGAKRPVPVPAPLAAPESSSRHDRRSESAQIEAISQPNTPAIIERPRRVTVRPKRVGEDDAEPEVEVEDEEDNYSSAAESDKGDPDEDGEELDDASSSGDKASSDGTRPRRKVSPTKKSLELMNAMSDESEGEALAQGIQHRAQKTLKLSHAAGAPAVMEYMPMDVTATGQGFPSDDEGGDKPKKKKRKPLPDGGLPMDTRPIKFVSDEERMIVMDEMAAPYKAARNSTTRERTRSAFVQSWLHYAYELSPGGNVCRPAMYKSYLKAGSHIGMENQINSASFGKAMRQAFPKIEVRRLGHRGNSTYHYTGIRAANTAEANLIAQINREDALEMEMTTANGRPLSERPHSDMHSHGPGLTSSTVPSPAKAKAAAAKSQKAIAMQAKKAEAAQIRAYAEANASVPKKSNRILGAPVDDMDEEGYMGRGARMKGLNLGAKRKPPTSAAAKKRLLKKKAKSSDASDVGAGGNLQIIVSSDPNAVILIQHQKTAEDLPQTLTPRSVLRASTTTEEISTSHLFQLPTVPGRAVDGLLTVTFTPGVEATLCGIKAREEHVLLALGEGRMRAVIDQGHFMWEIADGGSMRILDRSELY